MDAVTAALLNPPDGSYPFIEWEDLDLGDRLAYLHLRAGQMVSDAKVPYTFDQMNNLYERIEKTVEKNYRASKTNILQRTDGLTRAFIKSLRIATPPVNPKHLKATPSQIMRAEETYTRNVEFTEPVEKYTCLYRDRPAKGGEMITSITITDATPITKKSGYGTETTVYVAKAAHT